MTIKTLSLATQLPLNIDDLIIKKIFLFTGFY